jgi:phospholipase D1/2
VSSLRDPTAGSFAVLIGIGVVLIGLSLLLQRFLGNKSETQAHAHEGAPSDADKPRASDEAERAQRLHDRGMPKEADARRADEVRS